MPPYGCTVPPGVADSIATRVTNAFSLRQWWDALTRVSPFARQRFEITLENADSFRRETLAARAGFTPLGVMQGWSPGSMAEAARRLVVIGYDYLALDGMVPLKSPDIKRCLAAIRDAVPASTRPHILGSAKAGDIDSFDTTSPLIRAFKDAKQNYYYLPGKGLDPALFHVNPRSAGDQEPQAATQRKKGHVPRRGSGAHGKRGAGPAALRAFDRGEADLEESLRSVIAYSAPLVKEKSYEDCADRTKLAQLAQRCSEPLAARPWRQCHCAIHLPGCRD